MSSSASRDRNRGRDQPETSRDDQHEQGSRNGGTKDATRNGPPRPAQDGPRDARNGPRGDLSRDGGRESSRDGSARPSGAHARPRPPPPPGPPLSSRGSLQLFPVGQQQQRKTDASVDKTQHQHQQRKSDAGHDRTQHQHQQRKTAGLDKTSKTDAGLDKTSRPRDSSDVDTRQSDREKRFGSEQASFVPRVAKFSRRDDARPDAASPKVSADATDQPIAAADDEGTNGKPHTAKLNVAAPPRSLANAPSPMSLSTSDLRDGTPPLSGGHASLSGGQRSPSPRIPPPPTLSPHARTLLAAAHSSSSGALDNVSGGNGAPVQKRRSKWDTDDLSEEDAATAPVAAAPVAPPGPVVADPDVAPAPVAAPPPVVAEPTAGSPLPPEPAVEPAPVSTGKRSRWADDDSPEEGEESEAPFLPPPPPPVLPTKRSKWEDEEAGEPQPEAGVEPNLVSEPPTVLVKRSKWEEDLDAGRSAEVAPAPVPEAVVPIDEVADAEPAGEDSAAGETEEVAPARSPSPVLPAALHRCRKVDHQYERLNKIAEGTYGVVYRARDRRNGDIVALKKVKCPHEKEGFPVTALREITILLTLTHPNLVDVREIVMSPSNHVFVVMDFIENDFRSLLESMSTPFKTAEVKCLTRQLLLAVQFMHDHWIIHRDLKTANLLFNNRGILKVCDFGMARLYSDPAKMLTPLVVTLHYRAPELLLLGEHSMMKPTIYGTEIDMWSVGCIMGEFLLGKTLLPGRNEVEEIAKIFKMLGTPNESTWPGWSSLPGAKRALTLKHSPCTLRTTLPKMSALGAPTLSDYGYELLTGMLKLNPSKRISAKEALESEWFQETPLPKQPEDMPTFKPFNENPQLKRRKRSVENEEYRKLLADDDARFARSATAVKK